MDCALDCVACVVDYYSRWYLSVCISLAMQSPFTRDAISFHSFPFLMRVVIWDNEGMEHLHDWLQTPRDHCAHFLDRELNASVACDEYGSPARRARICGVAFAQCEVDA